MVLNSPGVAVLAVSCFQLRDCDFIVFVRGSTLTHFRQLVNEQLAGVELTRQQTFLSRLPVRLRRKRQAGTTFRTDSR